MNLMKKEKNGIKICWNTPSAVCKPINSEYSPSPIKLNAFTRALYVELKCSPSTVHMASLPQYTSCHVDGCVDVCVCATTPTLKTRVPDQSVTQIIKCAREEEVQCHSIKSKNEQDQENKEEQTKILYK